MHPLRFGLKLSQAATLDTLMTIWRVADNSGFDHCWNMDHFASLGPDDSLDIFEAWTLLAGMAAHTSHTRIGCSVSGNTYRRTPRTSRPRCRAAGARTGLRGRGRRRLPDPLTAALATIVAVQVAVLLVLGSDGGSRGACMFVGGAAVCLLAKTLLPDAVGWGDAKLAPSLALLLAVHGWSALYARLLAWCVLALAAALLDLLRHSAGGIVAYGPALVAGTAYGIAYGIAN